MSRTKKQSTEAAVREIRRRTRRKFAPEEKIIGCARLDAAIRSRDCALTQRGEASASQLCPGRVDLSSGSGGASTRSPRRLEPPVVSADGFEPSTGGLRVRCSAS